MTVILPPIPYFTDGEGLALDAGQIYVGEEGEDARSNPVELFWDAERTIPALQPIRTNAGFPTYQGTPSPFFSAEQTCSVTVLDRNGVPVYTNRETLQLEVPGALVSFVQSGTGAVTRTMQDKAREQVSILDFREPTDTVDTQAFVRVMDSGHRCIHFPAGKGLGPDGVYLISTVGTPYGNPDKHGYILPNTYLFGDGIDNTIIRPEGPNELLFRIFSDAEDETVDNVTLRDMTLYGYCETAGFEEQVALTHFDGVSNLLCDRVKFKAFQGDGLYIGCGETFGDLRHNYSVTARDCVFDGVNYENRNAITFIDIDGALVDNCDFYDCGAAGMPGAIDMEPDPSGEPYVIRNVTIHGSRFTRVGGNVGAIGVFMDALVPTAPRNIKILNNTFTDYAGSGAEFLLSVDRALTGADADMQIILAGNSGSNGNTPFEILSGKGIIIDDTNTFDGYAGGAILGYVGADDLVIDVVCCPTLRNIGGTFGILIGRVFALTFGGTLYKCGDDSPTAYPVQFTNVPSDNVSIESLFLTKQATQTIGINNDGHAFTAANNRFLNCYMDGLTNQFQFVNGVEATLTYANGWTAGVAFSVLRSADGIVNIFGPLGGGTTTPGTVMATLPAEFRPRAQNYYGAVKAAGAFGFVRIDTTGEIVTFDVDGTNNFFDISFVAA